MIVIVFGVLDDKWYTFQEKTETACGLPVACNPIQVDVSLGYRQCVSVTVARNVRCIIVDAVCISCLCSDSTLL